MNKTDLQAAVKSLGWTLKLRKIGKRHYYYAQKRSNKKLTERYLFPAIQIKDKQQADVWDKLLNAPKPRVRTTEEPTLATCPYCGQMHPQEFIEWCPLKPR